MISQNQNAILILLGKKISFPHGKHRSWFILSWVGKASFLLLSGLPEVGPHEDQQQLHHQEHSHPHDQPRQVQADLHTISVERARSFRLLGCKRQWVLVKVFLNRLLHIYHLSGGPGKCILFLNILFEFIRDGEGVSDEYIVPQCRLLEAPTRPEVAQPPRQRVLRHGHSLPPPSPVGVDPGLVPVAVVLVDALDRLAAGHAGGDQRPELHRLAGGELERVKASHQRFRSSGLPSQGTHDPALGRTADRVKQDDFVLVVSVLGDELPDKDLVRGVGVEDGEVELQGVSYSSLLHLKQEEEKNKNFDKF